MKDCPRYKWSELKPGKPFEIIIDGFLDAQINQYYGTPYVMFYTMIDIGVDKEDLRKCEFTLPMVPFLRAFQEKPLKERMKFKDKKMRLKVIKLGYKKMKIIDIEEVVDAPNL